MDTLSREQQAQIRQAQRRSRRTIRSINCYFILCFLGICCAGPLMIVRWQLGAAVFAGSIVCMGFLVRCSLRWRQAVLERSTRSDPAALGVFLDAYGLSMLGARARYGAQDLELRAKLLRMLPTVQARDAHSIEQRHRNCLQRILHEDDDLLVLAALSALQHLGDVSTISYVEKLVTDHGASQANASIRDAARTCLGVLMERTRKETSSQILVRAFGRPTSSSDSLMRPATAPSETNIDQLLRAIKPD